MTEDDLTPEQPAHQAGEVLHLCGRDPVDAIDVLQRRDATTEAQHEPTAGQALHRPGVTGGHHRVARVVVGGSGLDGDALGHRRGTGERRRLLLVVAL